MCIYTHTYMYICIHICVYIHIYLHIYTHVFFQSICSMTNVKDIYLDQKECSFLYPSLGVRGYNICKMPDTVNTQ